MPNVLAKQMKCVVMRNGAEIWMDSDKADKLQEILQGITESKFIRHEGMTINSADITGVFDANAMVELGKIKNGQWKCVLNNWHGKRDKCNCAREAVDNLRDVMRKLVAGCPECSGKMLHITGNWNMEHDCIKDWTPKLRELQKLL